jgi:SET domain-containing protein
MSVIVTNQFNVEIWEGKIGEAIYPLTSFMNHSCDPNCEMAFDGESTTAYITATKNIALGEELTLSYACNGDVDHEKLKRSYGSFDCGCDKGKGVK